MFDALPGSNYQAEKRSLARASSDKIFPDHTPKNEIHFIKKQNYLYVNYLINLKNCQIIKFSKKPII
jgi:hypothetical protein